ncbi:hypothetical protein SISSUDRAFT_1061596 [Sistotremastrum suecicum HHB10207 ss-3]|uniref:FZ domain-containing protein n=1 Tax=Sistotremastrum suecicum HHB10207 ss-3 TaxID=1314776 RepID=A0A166DTJ4_9AGAM|nr:hypothetical protein SISSUDRAFT_1061596 [Sistotremastrum suecicum HHB10207 ss-3]
MPPLTLWLLISAVLAQRQEISLNSIITSNITYNNSSPPTFTLPTSDSPINLSVSLCSDQLPSPRFFLNSASTSVPSPDGGDGGIEISLDEGLGTWNGTTPNGGILAVYTGQLSSGVVVPPWTFQLGVSNGDPLHTVLDGLPLLGDTTASQALIFSPSFSSLPISSPSYPNYTLPESNTTMPNAPPNVPNFTLALFPTSSSPPSLAKSACAVLGQQSANENMTTSLAFRGSEGFRTQWLVEDLDNRTNYTAFVVQDGAKVSEAIFLSTKSSSFACPLLHSLPFCPQTAYSVPLQAPKAPFTSYNTTNLDPAISSSFLSSLQNFSTTLSAFPCGRDVYSPLKGCTDCFDTYRTWLCAVAFPQCADPPSNPSTFFSPTPPSEAPTPALLAQTSSNRSPILPDLGTSHTILLPCIETCQAVDRSCPPFLGWRCPVMAVNANWSYGLGFIDGIDGSEGQGRISGASGRGVDRWGGMWCSGL